MAKVQKPDLKIIEPYDVSFAELRPAESWEESVQKVATAINVQFTESAASLPFVPFRQFASLLREEKLFLVGPSGSGKSRTIIELLRNRRESYDRIFVINPSNPAGLDSGRESIAKLSQRFGFNDLVIWDNFPDGLVKRDLESAFGALEIVNARPVQNLYIALKPTYLEMYRGLAASIPDIYTFEVYCDLETMKALIKAYGALDRYAHLFKFVSPNTDRIARLLWQKQPLSLTVVDYYKALAAKEGIDEPTAMQMAQTWLPVYDYFERQFDVIKNIPARREDVEFLYSLRLCYEVGFDRTHSSVAGLQKKIFGSEPPPEPTRELGTWVYLSGQNYSMHDSAKNAVVLTDHARMKVASFLATGFAEIVPAGDSELYSLGLFIGKNIEYMQSAASAIPEQIYKFMKTKAVFERAVGRGVGENFERLDDSTQERILNLVDTEIEFGVGLADSLGERFADLDDFNRNRIMGTIYQGMLFARYFGQSVGRLYVRLPEELQSLVTSHSKKNPQFADGLGMGLGYSYPALDAPLQDEILNKAKNNFDLSRGIGFGLGLTLGLLPEEGARKVIALADKNSELNTGFGMGMAVTFLQLPEEIRRMVLERVTADEGFAFGVGVYSAFFYKESCPPEIFELTSQNTEVTYGLGLGYGAILFYLPESFRAKIDAMLAENVKLDDGIGSGLGLLLKHFPPPAQEMMFAKAAKRNAFATGLAYGLGYTWRYVSDALKSRAIALAASNSDFARGLGFGFGCHLDYEDPEQLAQVISIADSNSELDRGLGSGAAWAWPYFGDSTKLLVTERINGRTEFARGMGFGVARVVKRFPESSSLPLLDRLAKDPLFAEGFSEGTGQYDWSTCTGQEKQRHLNSAAGSAEISHGLGTGIGLLHSYFKDELGSGMLKAFLKKNPNLRRGVGAGMGRAFKYLPQGARNDAFRIAGDDVEFAVGFGNGLGTVYNYLEESEQDLIWSNIGENGFTRGLGQGLGTVFAFLADDVQNRIISLAANNSQLSLGLGAGVAMNVQYLPSILAPKILTLAKSNSFLATGFGEGFAYAFSKLPDKVKSSIAPFAETNGFSLGFGVGVGKLRKYMTAAELDKAASFAQGDSFIAGYAIGLGSSAAYVPQELMRELLAADLAKAGFARNFGYGLGHALSQLSSEERTNVLNFLKGNEEFESGLGEGIGHYIPVTGSQEIEDVRKFADSPALSRGAAAGIAASLEHLDMAEVHGIIDYADSNPEYGKALGRSLALRLGTFDQERQSQIVAALQKDNVFTREFVTALPQNLEYVPLELRGMLRELVLKYHQLEASE